MLQTLGLITLGIGVLIVLGGMNGIRTGKLSKVQFGKAADQPAVFLEGDPAKRQGTAYVLAGIILAVIGVVMLMNIPSLPTIFLGLTSVVGGTMMTGYGFQGIRKQEVGFHLSHGRTRRLWGADIAVKRKTITVRYVGARAITVSLGYILFGLSAVSLGLIILLKYQWLKQGVIVFAIGFVLYVLSAVVAHLLPANAG
jgi:hypothetical protein